MSEQKKKEEKKQFGVAECPECDVSTARGYAGGGLFVFFLVLIAMGVLMFFMRSALDKSDAAGAELLRGVLVFGGCSCLLIGVLLFFAASIWQWIIGAYTYVFSCSGETHHHMVAPRQEGTRWLAQVWDREKQALVEKEITGPIFRLAFGGWFKRGMVLNGWPQLRVGRPEFRTFNEEPCMFIPISQQSELSGRIKETLAITPEEAFALIERIGVFGDRIAGTFVHKLIELAATLHNVERLNLVSVGEQERLREQNHRLSSGLSFAQGTASVIEDRLRAIVAAIEATKPGKGKKSEGQRSPVGQAAREAIEDTLWLVSSLAMPHPDQPVFQGEFDKGKEHALRNLNPLPAFVRPKEPSPAESSAAQG